MKNSTRRTIFCLVEVIDNKFSGKDDNDNG